MICDGALCPQNMGFGGGFLMSIYNSKTKKVVSINARETAPAASSAFMFENQPKKSLYGTVPIYLLIIKYIFFVCKYKN